MTTSGQNTDFNRLDYFVNLDFQLERVHPVFIIKLNMSALPQNPTSESERIYKY